MALLDRNAASIARSRRNWQKLAASTTTTAIALDPSSTNALVLRSTGYGVLLDPSSTNILVLTLTSTLYASTAGGSGSPDTSTIITNSNGFLSAVALRGSTDALAAVASTGYSTNPQTNYLALMSASNGLPPSVVSVGASTNIGLALEPKGDGALSRFRPITGATTAFGAGAVNLQTNDGNTQVASGVRATLSGGQTNTVAGNFGVVGGGLTNNITSTAFLAAIIGGNTNTITTSSSGTIAGGSTNTVSSTLSVVTGGGLNKARGLAATVAGGQGNVASGDYSVIAGGLFNSTGTAASSANNSAILGGRGNSTIGQYATVLSGYVSVATSTHATAIGRQARADHWAEQALSPGSFGGVDFAGSAQETKVIYFGQTVTSTSTQLFLDGGGSSSRFTIPGSTTYACIINTVARSSTSSMAMFVRQVVIDNTGGTVTQRGTTTTIGTDVTMPGSSTWTVTFEADDTSKSLKMSVNGGNATAVRWVAVVTASKVIY